ncbi:MAG: M56 family metallopeptidase [Candidatus Thiodiazotropha weberae]|nr:M56 family metallopeptidase [Candidatus Thiodiazotropha weberae]
MTALQEFVVPYLILLLCSASIVSVLAFILSMGLRQHLMRLAPRMRLPALALLLITPVFGTLLLAVWGSAPAGWISGNDHCTGHAASHSSACTWHLPQVTDPTLQGMLLAGLLIFTLFGAYKLLNFWRGLRQLETLKRLAIFDTKLGIWRLAVSSPLAFTSGLLRPAIFISEGLLQQLDTIETTQVCAHEQAHARRHDGLYQLLMRLFSLGHLPGMRRQLLKDWELACEQVCDQAVAPDTKNRLVLAQTLLRVARLNLNNNGTLPSACHLTGGDLECRVQALLHPAAHRPLAALFLTSAPALIIIMTVGVLAPIFHHWLEWL